jgi:hypothetical protein
MSLDWIGWQDLTPNEQLAGIGGGAVSLGAVLAGRALFRNTLARLQERGRRRRKRKAKRGTARKGGRR